jgi:hypothetical protein
MGYYGEALDYTRTTSYYGHFVKGFRKLYDFNDLFFTKNNIEKLSGQVEEKYKDTGPGLMKLSRGQDLSSCSLISTGNRSIQRSMRSILHWHHINALISSSGRKPEKDSNPSGFYKEAASAGFVINSLVIT